MIYLFVVVFTIGGSPPFTEVLEQRTGKGCQMAIENLSTAKLPDSISYIAYCFEVPTRSQGL